MPLEPNRNAIRAALEAMLQDVTPAYIRAELDTLVRERPRESSPGVPPPPRPKPSTPIRTARIPTISDIVLGMILITVMAVIVSSFISFAWESTHPINVTKSDWHCTATGAHGACYQFTHN